MRTGIYLQVCALSVLVLFINVQFAEGYALQPRQNDQTTLSELTSLSQGSSTAENAAASSTNSGTSDSSSNPSSTTTTEPSRAVTSTFINSMPTSISSTLIASSQASLSSDGPSPSSIIANLTAGPDPSKLPINPEITPGITVAGVLLILSGLVYTLIGIKNRWIYIPLSSAYIAALSVTVLIEYVMNPPVSNAIQGAYVVAATVVGIIIGGLSMLFPEVTEGLGCLLGGFCVGMWFMVLKPGGLVTSSVGRGVLLAAFMVATFSLAFSRYTRNYGLIFGISFAGATIVIIGADCFSRAGLKEFWLYIWHLNPNTFPLNTTHYPHTRGIRVEIACIIVIFLFGLASQLKIWKIIKERREKRNAERLDDERILREHDEQIGARVKEETDAQRADWEMTYGARNSDDSNKADSGVGTFTASVKKTEGSIVQAREITEEITETSNEPIEMTVLSDSGEDHGIEGQPIEEDKGPVNEPGDSDAHQSHGIEDASADGSQRISIGNPNTTSIRLDSNTSVPNRESLRASVPPPPPVVPLPFKVPTVETTEEDDDRSSIATVAESRRMSVLNSKRLSTTSVAKGASAAVSEEPDYGSAFDRRLTIRQAQDDHRSSVAVTVDELSENDGPDFSDYREDLNEEPERERILATARVSTQSSVAQSVGATSNVFQDPATLNDSGLGASVSAGERNADDGVTNDIQSQDIASTREEDDSKQISNPLTRPTTPASTMAGDDHRKSLNQETSQQPSNMTSERPPTAHSERARSVKSLTRSENSEAVSLAEKLQERFPPALSKVVMSYRTNEWAKHLSTADTPELEDLQIEVPDKTVEDQETETAAPVQVDQLQQTALTGASASDPALELSRKTSQISTRSLSAQSLAELSIPKTGAQLPQNIVPTNPSVQTRLYQQQSQSTPRLSQNISTLGNGIYKSASTSHLHRPVPNSWRSSSNPLMDQPLVESPIEDHPDAFVPPLSTPLPSNTLMGKRDALVRNKLSFISRNSSMTTISQHGYGSTGQLVALEEAPMHPDVDDLPLSQRKELLQNQAQKQQQPLRASTSQSFNFDSHQPKRDSSAAKPAVREAQLALWRESVQQGLAQNQQPDSAAEIRRAEMLSSRKAQLMDQRRQTMASNYRESMFDDRMRRGDMQELHKEAMRKMQAKANKHV